jgi:hypothetical protein
MVKQATLLGTLVPVEEPSTASEEEQITISLDGLSCPTQDGMGDRCSKHFLAHKSRF